MNKIILLSICMLFLSSVTNAAEIPESMSSKNVFLKSGGKIRYTSMYKLGQFVSALKSEAMKNNNPFKVSKSGSTYLLDINGKNRTNIKIYIDSNNFLKKYVIKNNGGLYSFDDSKPLDMVRAIYFILPFQDNEEEKVKAQSKIDQEKENIFVEKNMLNFDVQMPLFAGLQWGDKFSDVLKKLRQVNGISGITAIECRTKGFDPSPSNPFMDTSGFSQDDKQKYNIITKIRGDKLDLITDEEAKSINDDIDNCSIRGEFVLFNTQATITTHIGHTSHGGPDINYLNHVSICGKFNSSYDKMIDAYKNKYKDYNTKSASASDTRKFDKFGNDVDFGASGYDGNCINYWKSTSVSDLQIQMIRDENNKKISDQLKSKPQADNAL